MTILATAPEAPSSVGVVCESHVSSICHQ